MTIKLYHANSYLKEFDAAIIDIIEYPDNKWGIILDQTAFYPESGGQPFDTGTINASPVIAVYQKDNTVIHVTKEPLPLGPALGKIDWNRRFDHMQQHSGEHILSSAFLQIVGAENIGFHMSSLATQIDLPVNSLTEEQITAVEQLANEAVFANRPVQCNFVTNSQLDSLRLRKQVSKQFESIRIVDIDGFDCCPCGGTHVAATGEVGMIKIRSWERVRNGIRVDFVCGFRALADYRQKNTISASLSAQLSSPADGVLAAFAKQLARLQFLTKELAETKKEIAQITAEKLYQQAESIGAAKIVVSSHNAEPDTISKIAALLTTNPSTVALQAGINETSNKVHLIFACSKDLDLNMGAELKAALEQVNGRGGGNATAAQGGFSGIEQTAAVLATAKQSIIKKL